MNTHTRGTYGLQVDQEDRLLISRGSAPLPPGALLQALLAPFPLAQLTGRPRGGVWARVCEGYVCGRGNVCVWEGAWAMCVVIQ